MKRPLAACVLAVTVFGVSACQENSPTSVDPDGNPVSIETFEIDLPWSVFGSRSETYGGFGSPSQLGALILAEDYQGSLDSRAVVRPGVIPERVNVRRNDGILVLDSVETFVGGRLIATFDSTRVSESFGVRLGVLDQVWDPASATWEMAVDTFGVAIPWTEPGAGPVTGDAAGFWEVGGGDSLVVELPADLITTWSDSTTIRGFRLDLDAPGRRVTLGSIRLEVDARTFVRPDTVVTVSVATDRRTFIYTPDVSDAAGAIRVGGAPSFRSVVGLDVPATIDGPAGLCALVGCPYTIDPASLNRASLILTTRESQPAGFQPVDSIRLDVRPVLAPDALPKSPLGATFFGTQVFGPELFGDGSGERIEVQITNLVRSLLDPEQEDVPSDIALLMRFEPLDVSFAEFEGPSSPDAPILRLLLTVTDTVRYR